MAGNPIEQLFWGRMPIRAAHSEYYFTKGGRIQQLIHQLKYHQRPEAGKWLGAQIGQSMLASKRFQDLTCLIPLPLHPQKEKLRGYNQATVIAEGLSESLGIPVRNDIVTRARHTETQTRKHRQERWFNVAGGFSINTDLAFEAQHALLVDDVVTTGASLEACGQAILQLPQWQLSVATITFAQR
jgi:ComF family protein